ncbi:MAG: hypothetical protein V1835_02900 [Candidatus Micrarchaeota archaeon]
MAEFQITVSKFGDPLLDSSTSAANCHCLIDRQNRAVVLALSDPQFPPLREENRMVWLRQHGVVSDALNPDYNFPSNVEELSAVITPPSRYSPSKTISISIESPLSRESIAQFARAFWQLLETDGIPEGTRRNFHLRWKNYSDEEFEESLAQFLKRPRIISQTTVGIPEITQMPPSS